MVLVEHGTFRPNPRLPRGHRAVDTDQRTTWTLVSSRPVGNCPRGRQARVHSGRPVSCRRGPPERQCSFNLPADQTRQLKHITRSTSARRYALAHSFFSTALCEPVLAPSACLGSFTRSWHVLSLYLFVCFHRPPVCLRPIEAARPVRKKQFRFVSCLASR